MVIVLRLQRVFVRYALIALVFNVGPQPLLLPKYGYIAAAWITLVTELLVETLALRAVFRTIEMTPKFGQVHPHHRRRDREWVWSSWGLMAAGAPLACWWSRPQPPIRHCCSSCAP